MTKQITLTQEQMNEAAAVAKQLHDSLRKRGVKDAHGLRKADATAELEAGGAQAELAVSIALGVPWMAREKNDPYGPDVGTRTQVRSSNKPRDHHCLIVRPRDIEKYGDVPFLLVIQTGSTFVLKGWMMASEATQKRFLWDGGDHDRPKAWFVPERFLHSVEILKEV